MPLHIEELTSEVTVIDGDPSLSEKHKEMLVQLVIKKLGERAREAERRVQATKLRRHAAKPLDV